MIPYPTYKDPREYTERADLIDFVNHLKDQHITLIASYNDLEDRYNRLDTKFNKLKNRIVEVIGDCK